MITNCIHDRVNFQNIHKESVALIGVICDMISICLIYYFFIKLKQINNEYLEIIDNNVIKMTSFTIQIDNLILDKTMQDLRVLKMKLWLHFQKIIEEKGVNSKVVDV